MTPLVYDYSWDRWKLWYEASKRILQAAHEWKVVVPVLTPNAPSAARKFGTGGTFYGYWSEPNRIFVNVAKASTPPKTRGRVWSYPGHKTDRTAAGILAHEFGHHVAYYYQLDNAEWRKIVKTSKPVTSYEPTLGEALAETLRIYIWNPMLLYKARRERHDFLVQTLPRLHQEPYHIVLANAPQFIIDAAHKF